MVLRSYEAELKSEKFAAGEVFEIGQKFGGKCRLVDAKIFRIVPEQV